MARWKAHGPLFIRRNNLLRLIRYERKSVEVGVFRRRWVNLSADFRGKGASPTNHCWCQKTRVIAIPCDIIISAVYHLVLSQYTHLTDGRTGRQTELRQQYCALRYMQSHGNKTLFYVNIYESYKLSKKQSGFLAHPVR